MGVRGAALNERCNATVGVSEMKTVSQIAKFAALTALVGVRIAHAQGSVPTQPYEPPTNIREVCRKYEEYIVFVYNAMIEVNTKMLTAKSNEERLELNATSDSYRRGIVEREQSWNRLECAYLLYGIK